MFRPCLALLAPLLVTAFSAAATVAHADDFYKGKTIDIIVGFTLGEHQFKVGAASL